MKENTEGCYCACGCWNKSDNSHNSREGSTKSMFRPRVSELFLFSTV